MSKKKKKSDQKGHLQLIFQLERNKEWKVGLCSSIRVLCLSACVQMTYSEKQTLHSEKYQDMAFVPHGVFANGIMPQGSQLPASCLTALMRVWISIHFQ